MTCRHENIYWEDFFKEPKKSKAHCLDCNADKGKSFAGATQRWYRRKIEEWLVEETLAEKKIVNGHEYYFCNDFIEFLKKNNYDQYWNDLAIGNIDKDFEGLGNGVGGQIVFWETAKSIEYLCQEFKKEKEKDNPDDREREREREQISKKIKRLEQKTNRTPEEEAELADLRNRLRELENNTENKPVNYLPWIIGGSCLIVGLIILALILNNQKREK